jgi:pimeloyl-ACP methyl ester carboxylesterase
LEELQIEAGGVRLNLARGPEQGPPLLFLHGVLRRWQDFVPLLPAVGYRWQVHALDHRGHGGSQWGGSYRVAEYVQDTVNLLRGMSGPPVVLYGHSLGAMVACGAAAAAADRVAAVVLEDPPFETLGGEIEATPFHSQFAGMRDALRRSGADLPRLTRELAEVRITTPSGPVRMGDLRDVTQLRFSASCLVRIDPSVFAPLLAGEWLEGYDADTVLAGVRCPALLLAADGRAGGMMPAELVDRVEHLLPDCHRVDLRGIPHNAHWTDPQGIGKLVIGFLESLR